MTSSCANLDHVRTEVIHASEFPSRDAGINAYQGLKGGVAAAAAVAPPPLPAATAATAATAALPQPPPAPILASPQPTLGSKSCALIDSYWEVMSGKIASYFVKLLKGIYTSFQISLFKDELQLRDFIEMPLKEYFNYRVSQWLSSNTCLGPNPLSFVDGSEDQLVAQYISDPISKEPRLTMNAASAALMRHFEIEEHLLHQTRLKTLLSAYRDGINALVITCRNIVRTFENALPAIATRIKTDPQWRECKSVKDQANKLLMDNLKSRVNLNRIQEITPGFLGDMGLDYNTIIEAGPGLVRKLITDNATMDIPKLTPEACGNISQFEATFTMYQSALREIKDAATLQNADIQKKINENQEILRPHFANLQTWKSQWAALVGNVQVLHALKKMSANADRKMYTAADEALRVYTKSINLTW
jgi:hypothetical protein